MDRFFRHYLLSWALTAAGTYVAHMHPEFAPCVVALAGFLAHTFGIESGVKIGKGDTSGLSTSSSGPSV